MNLARELEMEWGIGVGEGDEAGMYDNRYYDDDEGYIPEFEQGYIPAMDHGYAPNFGANFVPSALMHSPDERFRYVSIHDPEPLVEMPEEERIEERSYEEAEIKDLPPEFSTADHEARALRKLFFPFLGLPCCHSHSVTVDMCNYIVPNMF